MVSDPRALDPAYRPTRPPTPRGMTNSHDPEHTRNGSSTDVSDQGRRAGHWGNSHLEVAASGAVCARSNRVGGTHHGHALTLLTSGFPVGPGLPYVQPDATGCHPESRFPEYTRNEPGGIRPAPG